MSQTILLVEDEPSIADTLTYALSSEGFEAKWVKTGTEAMTALESREIDLILLDVGLPDGNGFELCKQIRKTRQTPIIFITARGEEIDRVVGLEIGGDDYVTKPFSPREVTARVKAVLRRFPSSASTKASAQTPEQASTQPREVDTDTFYIDVDRMLISYFGTPLPLSRYEYRLLKILVERPGWVFSRDKLMEMAWEEPEMSTDRTVDAHVKMIRAKLRHVRTDLDPIRTHRGVGYSLKENL